MVSQSVTLLTCSWVVNGYRTKKERCTIDSPFRKTCAAQYLVCTLGLCTSFQMLWHQVRDIRPQIIHFHSLLCKYFSNCLCLCIYLISSADHYSEALFRNSYRKRTTQQNLYWPGIEPGPPARILPLNHQCLYISMEILVRSEPGLNLPLFLPK